MLHVDPLSPFVAIFSSVDDVKLRPLFSKFPLSKLATHVEGAKEN